MGNPSSTTKPQILQRRNQRERPAFRESPQRWHAQLTQASGFWDCLVSGCTSPASQRRRRDWICRRPTIPSPSLPSELTRKTTSGFSSMFDLVDLWSWFPPDLGRFHWSGVPWPELSGEWGAKWEFCFGPRKGKTTQARPPRISRTSGTCQGLPWVGRAGLDPSHKAPHRMKHQKAHGLHQEAGVQRALVWASLKMVDLLDARQKCREANSICLARIVPQCTGKRKGELPVLGLPNFGVIKIVPKTGGYHQRDTFILTGGGGRPGHRSRGRPPEAGL